ncbi:MAG: pyridoxamine 5'-phosphate oxidase family protein [Acidimicrobiia bacterium]
MDELSPAECRRILTAAAVGHLAVISDGEPYVSPISYVYMDDSIYVRTGPGRRVDAIGAHPRVCVEVSEFDDETGHWESMIIWGEAEIVDDDRIAQRVIIEMLEKYRESIGSPLTPSGPLPEPDIIIRVPVEVGTGRSSGSFFSVRTRPGRL